MTAVAETDRFGFGGNWLSFLELIDDGRVDAAVSSLERALGTDLQGKTFLDVGCGSGLFSLAAHRLGAKVRGFDVDADSVDCARELRQRQAPEAEWSVEVGSILDDGFVAGLGTFDVVYAWGVLHHTGDLQRALENVTGLVAPGGLLYLAIYNDQGWQSQVWTAVKRRYVRSGRVGRAMLVRGAGMYFGARHVVRRLMTEIRVMNGSKKMERGMSARHDLVDWVGGYPFEVAKPEAVFDRIRAHGFDLRYLKTCAGGLGCNEFVFERVPSESERIPSGTERVPSESEPVPSGIRSERGPSGPERVPSGPERIPSGTEPVPSGTEPVPSGTERIPSGSERVPSGIRASSGRTKGGSVRPGIAAKPRVDHELVSGDKPQDGPQSS